MNKGWTLDEAIAFVKLLEVELAEKCDAHCGIVGGVLMKGESEKDLDVVIYPHKKPHGVEWSPEWLNDFLSQYLGSPLQACTNITSGAYRDAKRVSWVRIKNGVHAGKRIDFFFLQ